MHKANARRSQGKPDYLLTSQERVVRKLPEQLATFTPRRFLSGKTLKAWRQAHNLTAQALALELGVTRQYIKSIEGGSLEASQKLIKRFDALRKRDESTGASSDGEPQRTLIITCQYPLPARLEILSKPRRCPGCQKYFVPVTPNQRRHTTGACQRAARRKRKGKRA